MYLYVLHAERLICDGYRKGHASITIFPDALARVFLLLGGSGLLPRGGAWALEGALWAPLGTVIKNCPDALQDVL